MGYFLIAISITLSLMAYSRWARIFQTWWLKRQGKASDLADASILDWPGLASAMLPRKARRVWNGFVVGACVLLLGIPHALVIRSFFPGGDAGPWMYAHYVWTLACWLALLALPAFVVAENLAARARDDREPAPGADQNSGDITNR